MSGSSGAPQPRILSTVRQGAAAWLLWIWLTSVVPLASIEARAAVPPEPAFQTPVLNPFGLTTGLAPAFVDIDGDGDLDVFAGTQSTIAFFRNTGTANSPGFAAPSFGSFGLVVVGTFPAPAFRDIDRDGDLDAFVGASDGNTFFFRNTGTAKSPAFAASSANPFGLTDVGAGSIPTLADLDGDGDLDAFVGASDGNTFFFANTGTAKSPAFVAPSTNPFGLTGVSGSAAPAFTDVDGDGDLDAFVGEDSGSSLLFQNTGSATSPAFAAPSTNPYGLTDVGAAAVPALADIDRDGDLDALIGNNASNLSFFLNSQGAQPAPFFAKGVLVFPPLPQGNQACFGDIDADGDLDAFIGSDESPVFGQGGGPVVFYRNTGTATSPAFAAGSPDAFGLDTVPGVGQEVFNPTLADLDDDGDLDAFLGAISPVVQIWANTGSATSPAFFNAGVWFSTVNETNLDPGFADIDGDGDLDALIGGGSASGDFKFFRNNGPPYLWDVFPSVNPFGLDVVGQVSASFADIDGDGDLDAWMGSNFTPFFRNTGTATAPSFAAEAAPFGLPIGPRDVTFADIDSDGDFDALAEGGSGTYFFRNTARGPDLFADGFELGNIDAWSSSSP